MKLAVIGVDGAHLDLIEPWISKGLLPNVAKIKSRGAYANMQCCWPPVTSPNWKCYSTGLNPGKIGIFWWENISFKKKDIFYPFERKTKQPEIWDYLSQNGYKVIVVNMPTTYPPKKVNGFFVSGSPDGNDTEFTYPKEVEEELKSRFNYKVHPDLINFIEKKDTKAIEEVLKIIKSRFEVALYLLKKNKADFVHVTTLYINILHHLFNNNNIVLDAWKIVDEAIGNFISEGYNIIIMSDHGGEIIKELVYINTWLEKEGYLHTKKSTIKTLDKLNINVETVSRVLEKLRIKNLVKRIFPKKLISLLPSDQGVVKRQNKKNKVKWTESIALASGQGPLYLNKGLLGKEYKKKQSEIIKKLLELKDPKNNKKVVKRIFTKEEIYKGEYMEDAPDLMIAPNKGYHLADGIGKEQIFGGSHKWTMDNQITGLFMAYGEDVKNLGELKNIKIIDLAPTILYYSGCEIPKRIDGKPLKKIFKRVTKKLKKPTISTTWKKSEKELIDSALNNL